MTIFLGWSRRAVFFVSIRWLANEGRDLPAALIEDEVVVGGAVLIVIAFA
jgi:uncharacterized membrane protein